MQWLIDLIIDAIGIPPVFVDRGDPFTGDFGILDFTIDGNWHVLDLSHIIDSGASYVEFILTTFNANVGEHISMRTPGNAFTDNELFMNTMTANVAQGDSFGVYADAQGRIEYRVDVGGWLFIILTVRGWWMGR